MVWESFEREIYAFPDMADGAGGVSASFHDRFHGQWCHYFTQRSLIFADPGWKFLWEKSSYVISLLGICIDVTSSWTALEYDAGRGGKVVKGTSKVRICILRIAVTVVATYGMYAFVKRDIGNYMLLKVHFVFFDYDEPLFFFLLDYVAVMGLFIFVGHYFTLGLKQIKIN